LKRILSTDTLAILGFAAVCYGCWQYAPWLAFVVGGSLAIGYAWLCDSAKAFQAMRKRNQD
jgi:hypothetical protein